VEQKPDQMVHLIDPHLMINKLTDIQAKIFLKVWIERLTDQIRQVQSNLTRLCLRFCELMLIGIAVMGCWVNLLIIVKWSGRVLEMINLNEHSCSVDFIFKTLTGCITK
jgi:hypothetical protein